MLGPLTLQLGHQALDRLIGAFGEASRLLGDSFDILALQRFLGECRIVGRNRKRGCISAIRRAIVRT